MNIFIYPQNINWHVSIWIIEKLVDWVIKKKNHLGYKMYFDTHASLNIYT